MEKGDDAFNSRYFAAMKAAHHPNMIAHVPGSIEPIHGKPAHAKMIATMSRTFPDVHVSNDPYPIQFGSGDWTPVITRLGRWPGQDGLVVAWIESLGTRFLTNILLTPAALNSPDGR